MLMIIADVTFYPVGRGESAGDTIRRAVEAMEKSGARCYPNSMATVLEANTLDEIFNAIKAGESEIMKSGFRRVETIIKIDHRTDKDNSVKHKLDRIGVSN